MRNLNKFPNCLFLFFRKQKICEVHLGNIEKRSETSLFRTSTLCCHHLSVWPTLSKEIRFFASSIHYRARHTVLCAYLTPDIIVQDANHTVGVGRPN